MTMSREDLAEEYLFFRRWGYDDHQIAERFGMKYQSMAQSLRRVGVPIVHPEDWQTHEVLERLIASGDEFTIDHLPDRSGGAQRLLNRAIARGRVEKVGFRSGLMVWGKRVGIYRAVK